MHLNGIKMDILNEFFFQFKFLNLFIDVKKMLNFGICRHHSLQFIKFLLIILIILYIGSLNVIKIQK